MTRGMALQQSRPPTRVTGTAQSLTRQSRQQELADIEEDEICVSKPPAGPVDRNTYHAPQGYDTPLMIMFNEYLDKTQLQTNFSELIKMLLNRQDLPYNPYSGFVIRLRKYSEKYHMEHEKSRDEINHLLQNAIEETLVPHLYTIQGNSGVWGLFRILRVVNPSTIVRYRWLLESLTPTQESMLVLDGYTNQLAIALVGPTVFEGTLYPLSFNIQFRMEYLVTGPEETQAIAIFVNSVMSEIDALYSHHYHRMLGVNLPIGDSSDLVFWNPEKIKEEKEDFIQALSDTVTAHKYIFVECIFQTEPDYPVYKRGQKQYTLTFIELEDDIREEGLVCFSKFQLASLHEGIFLNFSHAEIYTSAFISQMEQTEESPATAVRPTALAGSTAPTRKASMLTRDQRTLEHHVHNQLHHVKPRKVRIDGFHVGDEANSGPYAWQITTDIKADLEKKIASHHSQAELFETIYAAVILFFLDSDAFKPELLVEVYKMMHGAAGRLYLLMEQNKGLRAMIQAFSITRDANLIREQISVFKEAVEFLFENSFQERSGEQRTVGCVIIGKLEEMLLPSSERFTSWAHIQKIQKTLKNINWYCLTLLIQLAEDSLECSEVLKKLINTMQEAFSVPRQEIGIRAVRQRPKREQVNVERVYKHGYEEDHIMKHDRFVVNVDACMKSGKAQQSIARESVLATYLLGCHIDEIWSDMLLELAGGQYIPPNPYPRFITRMRQCSARMDLCYEKSSVVLERLETGKAKVKDVDNFIYHIPGVDAFGCHSALMMLDVGPFLSVLDIAKQFTQQDYIKHKGPYNIGICLAVSGPSIWYGKMQPYLNEVELHEHYYIQGPPGYSGDAMRLCAFLVHAHVVELILKNHVPVAGVYFGADSIRWNWETIISDRRGFAEEFFRVCSNMEPVYMKAYCVLDKWKYVLVKKSFMLHFLTDDNIDSSHFYPVNPPAFYQSLFLTKERAAFHYQNGGGFHRTNPMNLANVRKVLSHLHRKMATAERVCDWITFHRCLLLQSLMLQKPDHKVNSWRMLHSRAGMVEYLISLTEVLHDLAMIGLEHEHYQKRKAEEAEMELMNRPRPRPRPKPETRKETKGRKREERAKTKAASRQGRPPTEPEPADDIKKPEYVNPIDDDILGKMTVEYLRKLLDISDLRSFMAPSALSNFLVNKLKTILEKDPFSGQLYIIYEEQALHRLKEMQNMLRMMQDSLAGDVHSICPEATDVLQSTDYQEVYPERSHSVTSDVLDDPSQYRLKPLQMRTIFE